MEKVSLLNSYPGASMAKPGIHILNREYHRGQG
jgi:hypothetical protein